MTTSEQVLSWLKNGFLTSEEKLSLTGIIIIGVILIAIILYMKERKKRR